MTPRHLSRCGRFVLVAIVFGVLGTGRAQAELLFRWRQTGADVTATVSGTIDGAWGSPQSGGSSFWPPTGGSPSPGQAKLAYGFAPSTDVYFFNGGPYSLSPSISFLSGTMVGSTGATVNGSTTYLEYTVSDGLLALVVPAGVTVVDAEVVWSNKLLADFFSEPNLVLSTFSNGGTLGTLQIEGVPEIDPAGFGSIAALVAGAFGLLERRRLPKPRGR